MKSKKLVDDAIKNFKESGDWYEISNLTFDLEDAEGKQYLFDQAEQIYAGHSLASEFTDIIRWAITNKLSVSKSQLENHENAVMKSIQNKAESTSVYSLLQIAGLYQKETYSENLGVNINNPEKIRKCVSMAWDMAESADDYSNVIAFVSEQHSGLYLGDKAWGNELLDQVKNKVDVKIYKKIEKSVAPLLS